MLTIKNNNSETTIIKKSKFISFLFFIENEEEALNILSNTKLKYNDATHVCYCYICNGKIRFSDDSEPSNTAGMPIYNVLKNNNLNHVLAIVVRYFGGIKLGAGGLVRAYSNCISNLVNNNIANIKDGYLVEITFDYNQTKNIEYILNKQTIINKNYDNLITFEFKVNKVDFDNIKNALANLIINFKIKKDILLKD